MPFSYYITLITVLATLIAVLLFFLRITKKIYLKRYSGDIKITDRVPIDTNVSIMILDVRGKELLVSIANKDVKVLMEL
jgi:flagellar biogenesis protein FliO